PVSASPRLCFDGTGAQLALAYNGQRLDGVQTSYAHIEVWNTASRSLARTWPVGSRVAVRIRFDAAGTRLLSLGSDASLRFYAADSGVVSTTVPDANHFAVDLAGNYLAYRERPPKAWASATERLVDRVPAVIKIWPASTF
ncbi:MAG TPA: hypothetical protein VM487_24090, partial [Phycisphaerae bacterium]|nr:hypothetical protein [Phycisphaerae bacterium]